MAKQAVIPGMENRKLKDLHEAAERFIDLKENAKTAREREKEAGETLIKLMRKHKKEVYRCAGIDIRINPGVDKAIVKIVHDEEGEGEQEKAAKAVAGGEVN